MNWIKATNSQGRKLLINLDKVKSIVDGVNGGGCWVCYGYDDDDEIEESYDTLYEAIKAYQDGKGDVG